MSSVQYAVESEPQGYIEQPKKKKKIGFFKRWMLKTVKEAVESERNLGVNLSPDLITSKRRSIGLDQPSSIDQPERAIQFTVYTANGGRVVETRRYDRKTDRSSNGLYVITGDQDFGKEIDKIITMEALR
jgi:hypothetical protein